MDSKDLELQKQIGLSIKKQLLANGMNMTDLAKELGVTIAAVSNWCKGIKSPRMTKVDKMCKIFNCSRIELLAGSQAPSQISESETYLDLYGRLDDIDRGAILERMRIMLEAKKYKA